MTPESWSAVFINSTKRTGRLSHRQKSTLINSTSNVYSDFSSGWILCPDRLSSPIIKIISCVTFSSPEPTILLACARNWEALRATISGMRHRCRLRDTGWAEFGYFLSYFRIVAPRAIPAAGQKDRRLWGRECLREDDANFSSYMRVRTWATKKLHWFWARHIALWRNLHLGSRHLQRQGDHF